MDSAVVAPVATPALLPDVLASSGVPTNSPAVLQALETIRVGNAWTLEQQVSICEIPAPPFKEEARGREFAGRLRALGMTRVHVDSVGNVIAERPGSEGGPVVVVAAHLDTVFPEGTDVRVRRDGTKYRAPGISDDCRGLAALLAVVRALETARVETRSTLVFVGSVGEEGPGNLRGVRHLIAHELAGRIASFVAVDGAGDGFTARAVGSNRYRITFQGPGGHSYGDFGMPNPIHALGRAIALIAEIQVPATPKATFNVGVVGGGTSVNSIAGSTTMEVDLRSESPVELARADSALRAAVARAFSDERARWPRSDAPLSVRYDTIGLRPAASPPASNAAARAVTAAARALGFETRGGASSTDANIPMSLGIPAIEMDAGGMSGGAHSLSEWYDDGPRGWVGPQWVMLTALTLAGVR